MYRFTRRAAVYQILALIILVKQNLAGPLQCLSRNGTENLKAGFKGASLSTKLDMVEGDEGGCAYCAPPTDPTLKPGCGAAHELGRKQRAWAGTHSEA